MVSISPSKTARLFVVQLEDRCVMTTLPWPVAAADNLGLTATYGQFDDRTDTPLVGLDIHFHEGIDIVVGVGTKVYAIEAGTVAKVISQPDPYDGWVSISTTADSGWNYAHIAPDPALTEGKTVVQGALIGTVGKAPAPLPTHLHLEAAGGLDPSFTTTLRQVADPLARLTPLGDTIAPTMGDIHFMRASDDTHNLKNGQAMTPYPTKRLQEEPDRLITHGYFKGQDHTKAWIVGHYATAKTSAGDPVGGNSNIDIIANIYDQMTAAGPLLGVRSVEFRATGQLLGKTIPTVRPFDFAGEFVWDPNRFPPGQQTHDATRISDFTRVVYENDYTSPSSSVEPRSFFYIVSNTDGANSIVDFADRNRYWRSKVTQGAAWNDINSTEAVNNAKGAFPDDYYEFTVTAKDAAGKATSKTQKVLLDNWVQDLNALGLPPQLGDPPDLIRVRFTGSNWTANASVPVSIVDPFSLVDGVSISSIGYLLTDLNLKADPDGNIPATDYEFTAPVWPDPWVFLADYAGGDNVYQPRLDAVTILETGETIVAPGVSASLAPASPVVPPAPNGSSGQPLLPPSRVGGPTVLPAPDDTAAFHGVRADTPAPSKLAVVVPDLPEDPLELPGEFDV